MAALRFVLCLAVVMVTGAPNVQGTATRVVKYLHRATQSQQEKFSTIYAEAWSANQRLFADAVVAACNADDGEISMLLCVEREAAISALLLLATEAKGSVLLSRTELLAYDFLGRFV